MADIPVIFEDNHLLVVEKPVNMPSQEDESRDLDMLTALKQDLKERYQKPGNVYLGLVHRLDRPVGGVMAFAKTSKAASRMSDMVRSRAFEKLYIAVLRGKPQQADGRLVHYLLKDSRTNTVKAVPQHTKDAKEAILDYRVLASKDGLSLALIELHTGRPHQIRVQFASIGCPLYGDQKYGADVNERGQQIALWSTKLSFAHPVQKETVTFRSYPPRDYPWNLWSEELYHNL